MTMPGFDSREERFTLNGWLNQHSLTMLSAAGLGIAWNTAATVGVAATMSFAILWYRVRTLLGSTRRYGGMANQVTALRFALIAAVALQLPYIAYQWVLILFSLNVLLDVLDGFVARRRGQVSSVGTLFDREVDAVFVLVAYLYFVEQGWGIWLLIPGLLPYIFRIVVWSTGGSSARDRKLKLASALAGLNFVVLLIAIVAEGSVQRLLLLASVLVVALSFSVSFLDLYRYGRSLPQ
jgi:phosphatidylglycerophosphate synthase